MFYLNYIIAAILVVTTSVLGSIFTNKNTKTPWYLCIKPKLTPPAIVFPIVWTTLYIMIFVALSRVLANPITYPNIVMVVLFVANLTLNVLWCWAYFSQKKIMLSLVLILILVATTIALIFSSRDFIVTVLLLPYLAWLCFATYLNYKTLEKEKECSAITI